MCSVQLEASLTIFMPTGTIDKTKTKMDRVHILLSANARSAANTEFTALIRPPIKTMLVTYLPGGQIA